MDGHRGETWRISWSLPTSKLLRVGLSICIFSREFSPNSPEYVTPTGSGASPPHWLSQLLLSQLIPQLIRGFWFSHTQNTRDSDLSGTPPPGPASCLVGWAIFSQSRSYWVLRTGTPAQTSLTPEPNCVGPAPIPNHFS